MKDWLIDGRVMNAGLLLVERKPELRGAEQSKANRTCMHWEQGSPVLYELRAEVTENQLSFCIQIPYISKGGRYSFRQTREVTNAVGGHREICLAVILCTPSRFPG